MNSLLKSSVVLLICLLVCLQAAQVFSGRFNLYEKNYVEDSCKYNETIDYYLSGNGPRSSMKISDVRNVWLRGNKNCTIHVHTPEGYGVILFLNSAYLVADFNTKTCDDYLEIFDDRGNSTKLCRFLKSKSFVTSGNMRLHYFTHEGNTVPTSGFTFTITAYKKDNKDNVEERFMCWSGHWIWDGFACDSVVNCPDSTDEFTYELTNCVDVKPFTLKPVDFDWNLIFPTSYNLVTYRKSYNVTLSASIASAILILLVIVSRFICHYHCLLSRRREALRRISIIRASAYAESFPAPPPPYTSLINEPIPDGIPPAYSTVVSSDSTSSVGSTSDTALSSEGEGLDNTSVSSGRATKEGGINEPPPPYEP